MNPLGRLGEQLREPLERRLVQAKMSTPESLGLERVSRLLFWGIAVSIPRINGTGANDTAPISVISGQIIRQGFAIVVN